MGGAHRRHRNMRGRQCRRVVHAVTDHHDLQALSFQLIDPRNFVGRGYACTPFMNSERLRGVTYRGLAIAGEDLDSDTTLLKCGDRSGCIWTQPLPYRKDVTIFAISEGDN